MKLTILLLVLMLVGCNQNKLYQLELTDSIYIQHFDGKFEVKKKNYTAEEILSFLKENKKIKIEYFDMDKRFNEVSKKFEKELSKLKEQGFNITTGYAQGSN